MKETSVHIKNIMESDSSVIIRFAILLCLSGCENFSGPSRNGPLVLISINFDDFHFSVYSFSFCFD